MKPESFVLKSRRIYESQLYDINYDGGSMRIVQYVCLGLHTARFLNTFSNSER